MDIRGLRNEIDDWVERTYPGGSYSDAGAQRLVYEIPAQVAALKIWITSDAVQHERHVREVSALARLDHPYLPSIVAALSQVEIEGRLMTFYLEQWIEAPSMKSQLNNLPFDAGRFQAIAVSASDALAALHAANIVHRDISLGNVLAGADVGYVIDLGLAKHLDLDTLTGTDVQLPLTQITASPEQLQGASGDLLPSTDVYSLGVVLVYGLTGRHPFINPGEAINPAELVFRQLSKDSRNVPARDLGDLLRRMLDPVAMYRPSAQAVLEELS